MASKNIRSATTSRIEDPKKSAKIVADKAVYRQREAERVTTYKQNASGGPRSANTK